MNFDMQSLFSDKQAITATTASTNVIDLGAVGTPQHANGPNKRDLGRGVEVPMRVQVTEDFNNLTSLTVAIQVNDDEAFGSAKEVSTVTVLAADLVAGAVIPPQYVPRGVDERYCRLNYTVTGPAPTTGKITAGLVFGNDTWAP